MTLDVFDDQLRATRVADIRRFARIVQRVGEVAGQHDVAAQPHHLADAERAGEDAVIGVHAHQDDVLDPLLLAKVVDLDAVVADAVKSDDVDPRIRQGITFGRTGLNHASLMGGLFESFKGP
jgi:hypothetical protein